MTNAMVYQILSLFGLQAIIFIIALITINVLQKEKKRIKMIATAAYSALKALRNEDPIFYNSVIMALPELEKKIVSGLLTPNPIKEENNEE